jgi:iron only hydrogenase large subunit-like protein
MALLNYVQKNLMYQSFTFVFDNIIFFNTLQKIEEESKPKVAKITLNDCLACSGCITSAESILIDQQDYREAQRVLKLNQSLDQNVYSSRFSIP